MRYITVIEADDTTKGQDDESSITSHPWYSNVQAAARVDLGATILAQLDGDTKIVQNKFGAYYVSRAGKAARCERVNGLYFRSSAR